MNINIFLLIAIFSFKTQTIYAFPQGRCFVNACDTTPYQIQRLPNSNCFDITMKTCMDPSKYQCCNGFNNGLHKIVFASQSMCQKSVRQVSVNGVQKAGGLFFVTDGQNNSEFRITSLRLNNITAPQTTICITLDPTNSKCNTWETFCPTPCLVSTFDPFSHNCCATCRLYEVNTTSPSPPNQMNTRPQPQPQTPNTHPQQNNCTDIQIIKQQLQSMNIMQIYKWIY